MGEQVLPIRLLAWELAIPGLTGEVAARSSPVQILLVVVAQSSPTAVVGAHLTRP
jgi:hypothetical protein